ncbi:acriflavin resistance protein [Lysobacteraceae bacterium NML03-0222]|nr:acriflavin resistance protein [Xanthomonadaceae bacterium NML03-0222]
MKMASGFDWVEFSTRRRVTVLMATLTLVLFGLIALSGLKVNLLPDLSYPTLTIRTEYTGAAPAEIETLITRPVEEAVGVARGLRKLKSVSRTGQSDVVLAFAWGTDMDKASLEVRDKMEALQLPLEAKPPTLLHFNPSTAPIMRLVISSSEAGGSLPRLRRYADDDLKRKLETVPGVASVKVAGGLEDEIRVDIDPQRLAALNIPLETVISRLQQENVNLSGGRLEDGSQRWLVRTVNQFATVEDIESLLLTSQRSGGGEAESAAAQMARVAAASGDAAAMSAAASVQSATGGSQAAPGGGLPVRLKDVAQVTQGYKEREAIIRLGGQEAVELAIYKEGDANTVATADEIEKALAVIRKQLPQDVSLAIIEDQSGFIRNAIADVKFDALLGGALAVLVIFLFLRDGWSTFVISLSLPVSIITTFFFMGQLDLSLNVMSLGGLALATGLVVDDSIVVLESIAKARERGLGVLQAAIAGTREVSLAVVASTLTTIAVFLPLVFVEGIAGQLFRDQALTVAIAIAVSLVVSMTLIPMLSSLKARAPLEFPDEPLPPAEQREVRGWRKPLVLAGRGIKGLIPALAYAFAWMWVRAWRLIVRLLSPIMQRASDLAMRPYARAENGYLQLLPKALAHPGKVLLLAAIAFAISMWMLPRLGTDLIPQLAQERFEMTVKLPPGTPLRETDALLQRLQAEHGKAEGVRALYGVSGSGTRLDANPADSGENIAKLSIVMENGGSAALESRLSERLRQSLAGQKDVAVDFSRPELFALAAPLEIEISGSSLESVEAAGRDLAERLRAHPHYTDVKTTVEQGWPEVRIHFDQSRAAALGLTTRQIADAVVKQIRGEVATRYHLRERQIDVRVRAEQGQRSSVEDIRNLLVNIGSGTPLRLSAVAEVEAGQGPSEIHRADQARVALVSANLHGIDLGTAMAEVQRMVAEKPLGADIALAIGGQGEELEGSLRSLLFAFALAVFLVYLVMASQFESLLHPFVILFTIPLALVGAVLALFLTGHAVSVVVFIGLILLVGLVTKNAIILVDRVNQLRIAGLPKRQALLEGARSRLRPIVMTSACTLFGFLPLALAMGEGAEVRSPMAITVIGGLIVSTLLTLLVIPVMYDLLDRKSDADYAARAQREHAENRALSDAFETEGGAS